MKLYKFYISLLFGATLLLIASLSSCKKPVFYSEGNLDFSADTVVFDTIFTTIGFQVISNFANDYGDGIKGTDTIRIGEERMVSSGKISPKQMKLAIIYTSILTIIIAVMLIYKAFGSSNFGYSLLFFCLGIISVMAFSTPNFSYDGKVIYAVITYSLLLLLYASSNLPYSALSGVITGDMKERNSISSYRFVAVMFAQFFVQVFMLPIIIYAGAGDKAIGIEIVMTWLAVIGTIMLLITFFTTKERIVPAEDQKSSLLEDLQDLMTNKPWVIMLILTTLIFISLESPFV